MSEKKGSKFWAKVSNKFVIDKDEVVYNVCNEKQDKIGEINYLQNMFFFETFDEISFTIKHLQDIVKEMQRLKAEVKK